MSARQERIRNLGAAGVLAVAAAILAALALPHHGSDRAQAAAPSNAHVLVANRNLSVGTSLAAALASHAIAVKRVTEGAIAQDAITSIGATAGKVVVQPIYAGEQVTVPRIGQTGAAGLRAVLSGSARIIQVSGEPDQLLAGTVHDGDHIDVVASVKRGSAETSYVGYAVRNVVVLSAPTDAASDGTDSATGTASATLELSDAQVAHLYFVMQNGSWSFVLRPTSHVAATATTVSAATALSGGE